MNDMKNLPQIRLGIAGRLTQLFLHNTVLSILSIAVIVVWGVVSFVIMPKQYNPEIVAPAFVITTDYPNATSHDVYEQITRPMEDKIAELKNIDGIASQSLPGGRSIVTVKFEIGSDQGDAKIALNQKLQDNMMLKPLGAQDPMIQSIDPDDVPIVDIGLSSHVYGESSLRKMAFDVADELKQVEGVSKVDVVGGRTQQLSVMPRSTQLAAHQISMQEIMATIASANGVYTSDMITGDQRNFVVNVSGTITSPQDAAQLIVREENGAFVRLGDVAEIAYDTGEITNYIDLTDKNGEQPIVHIALAKLKGTNATTVSDGIKEKLETLHGSVIPSDVATVFLRDEGEVAQNEISKLTFDLIKSIVIVAVLLMVFLGVRNSMVAAVSIPLVLLVVFGMGLLFGQTVNRITLFALILSLGLLVDDAIVVIENIARYFRLYPGEDKKKVIVSAVNEVGSALSLSTVTMALAFVPMAFVTGMMGPYMGPIPFFVPVALLASLVLSGSINPFLALLFTKQKTRHTENIFLRGFGVMEKRYAQCVAFLLAEKKRYRMVIIGVAVIFLFSIILPFTPLVPFRMLPKADRDQFYVYLDLPSSATSEQTRSATRFVTQSLLYDQFVENVESFSGEAPVEDFNGLFRGSAQRIYENQSTIRVNLTSHEERKRTSEEIAQDFRVRAQEIITQYPDLSVRIVEDPPGPPVLATFLVKVTGDDDKVRERITDDLLMRVRKISGIDDIDVSTPDHILNYTYKINTDKAQQLGVAPAVIASTLHTALTGSVAGIYYHNDDVSRHAEQEYIIVRLPRDDRDTKDVLSTLSVATAQGAQVGIMEFLEKTDASFDVPIVTDERRVTTYVSGEMVGRSVVYASIDLLSQLRTYHIPDGDSRLTHWSLFGAEYEDVTSGKKYHIMIDGEWKLTLEVFRDLGIAMGVAIFMIYFVLAGKIRSLFIPLLIMVSIPLGFIGVFPGFAILFLIKGTYFNATSMIGIIALSGLSVKNAVIFLEYLEPLRATGHDLRTALVETGRIRLLPIILTSLTAILGSLTIISDPVWEGLAWALIFGLTVSTILTLVIFPLMYYAIMKDRWQNNAQK
jgi:multidrug efflux pump subunit AcrB